jgi:hypothetical protein
MPVHPGIVGMLLDAVAEMLDRLAIAAEVCEAAPEPDGGVGVVGIAAVNNLGVPEILLEGLPCVGGNRRWKQRLAQQ